MNAMVLELHRRFGRHADELAIERVDWTKPLGCWVQVRTTDRRRWLAIDGRELREFDPGSDPALPLAARLEELRAQGPVEVLSYRPGRRLTLRVAEPRGPQVLKGYRPGRLEDAARRHREVLEATRGSALRAPELISTDPSQATLVLEDLGGRPAGLSGGRARRVGEALRALQDHPGASSLPIHGSLEELRALDRAGEKSERLCGSLPRGWRALRDRLEVHDRGEPVTVSRAHRDLHDGQLLDLPGAGLGWLDFDLASLADPALDAANLSAHLELRVLQRAEGASAEQARACTRELRLGLGRDDEPAFRAGFVHYRAATFLRLALVYQLRPRWTHLCGALVDRAQSCVEEACRALA